MSRDLHIQLVDPKKQTPRSLFTFGFSAPIAVSGPQILMNRWLKVFMTPKGTHPTRKKEGTLFPRLIGANVGALGGIEPDVLDAIDDTTAQIKAADRAAPSRPTNERIQAATLLRFVTLPPAGIEFWVEITNMAGEKLAFLIPYAPG